MESLRAFREEVDNMTAVLLGHEDPPMESGIMTLMEVADAYFARGKDIEGTIHRMEADGVVARGSKLYRFRTGELRSFLEMAKSAVELGSRRVTAAKMEMDEAHYGIF